MQAPLGQINVCYTVIRKSNSDPERRTVSLFSAASLGKQLLFVLGDGRSHEYVQLSIHLYTIVGERMGRKHAGPIQLCWMGQGRCQCRS